MARDPIAAVPSRWVTTLRSPFQTGTDVALRQWRRPCRLSSQVIADGVDVRGAMSVLIAEIVRHSILHAQRLASERVHDWPTARAALTKILADLEQRSPNEPSLSRLRIYIATRDRAWSRDHQSPKASGVKTMAAISALGTPSKCAVSLDLSWGLLNICLSAWQTASSHTPPFRSQAKCRPHGGRRSADDGRRLCAAPDGPRRS